jgi:hypothetical protein
MKSNFKAQDTENAKKILADAMTKALLSMGDDVHKLSIFCTTEEQFAKESRREAA